MVALPAVLARVEALGLKVFTRGILNVNIVGVRTASRVPGAFDDYLCVVWKDESGDWVEKRWPITTDPGLYWLEHPLNVDGTAILAPGQYRGAYTFGLHPRKDGYPALVQRKEVAVYRDGDRDAVLDASGELDWGFHGINIHRASSTRQSLTVHKWSAGCQVFADPDDFAEFLGILREAAAKWGDSFTYTLIED